MALAIGVSAALHVAAGMYLYTVRTRAPEPAPPEDFTTVTFQALPKAAARTKATANPPVKVRPPAQTGLPTPPVTTSIPFTPMDAGPVVDDLPPVFDGGPRADLNPQPIRPKVIGRPTWIAKPSGAQLARYYPQRAMNLGLNGAATLNCAVNAVGTVRDCTVVAETPADMGFGAAAVKLSRFFRMQPKTEDGQPVDGGQVSIPVSFRIE
jgi:protein TonB